MRFLKQLIIKNSFFSFWYLIFFVNFNILLKKNLFFFKFKAILILFIKFFYFKKLKLKLIFILFLKKQNKIINLSFFITQKLKLNFYLLFLKSNTTFFLQGRGFRVADFKSSALNFKLGFTHNIFLTVKKSLTIQILVKNAQKFKLAGNLLNIIQILSCLNFLKKKNLFTAKGIFYANEKIKLKKSTKSSW